MIPQLIKDYATNLGFTKQKIYFKQDGITYYHLSKPREDGLSHKIGFPTLVRIKHGNVIEVPFDEAKTIIIEASKAL